MIRNLASNVARVASRSAARNSRPTFRAFSDFQKKERSEEARYFAEQEKEKIAAMKAKMEAILASDNQQSKEELIGILGTCRKLSSLKNGRFIFSDGSFIFSLCISFAQHIYF
jgi:hypothetical protein